MQQKEKNLETRIKSLEEHLRAENNHDLNAIMASYGPNPVVNLNGQAISGEEAIRFFHDQLGFGGKGAFSEIKVIEKKRHISGSTIILQQEVSGKHTGIWQGIKATNRPIQFPVCTIYIFNQLGQLVGEDVYFDNSFLLRQIN